MQQTTRIDTHSKAPFISRVRSTDAIGSPSMTRYSSIMARATSMVYLWLLALLPFHAFMTTWAGSNFGHLDAWRIWKEVAIVLTIPGVAWLAYRTPTIRRWLLRSWLIRLIGAYVLLGVITAGWALADGRVNGPAVIYGLLADFRFVGFLVLTAIAAAASSLLAKRWRGAVLVPLALVTVFGLLQLALPYDFLRHFGYGPHTIPAYQTVDNKIAYQRIQSTLRGANPLGAYLVIGITAAAVVAWRSRRKWLGGVLAALGTVALFYSYSRSAYIGLLVSLMLVGWLLSQGKYRKWLSLAIVGGAIVCGMGIILLRNNDVVQNTFFHSDETSQSGQSSNTGRAKALEDGLKDVAHQPFGEGPGTAGPASTRNNHPARIAENYFLQVGQELGWLGLGLFVAINWLVGLELWRRRSDGLALILLGSLVGLTIVNLLSHAWADDTLGLLWWGLAGIVVGSDILKTGNKPKTNEIPSSQKSAA